MELGTAVIMKRSLAWICAKAQTGMHGLYLRAGFALLALFLVIVTCLTACSYYKTYSGQVKELDFAFEYPRGWRIVMVEKYPDLVYMNISAPYTSETGVPVGVSCIAYPELDSYPEQWAQDNLNLEILTYSKLTNFELVYQETTSLDGYDGYRFECTYDFPTSDLPDHPYNHIRKLVIIVPKDDVVYKILISASQDEWNTHEQDIQHVLDTFRWK